MTYAAPPATYAAAPATYLCDPCLSVLTAPQGRRIVLTGTAHISPESVELVRRAIRGEKLGHDFSNSGRRARAQNNFAREPARCLAGQSG